MLKLTLDNLEVKELVDLGSFLDKQDPQLSITVGNKTHNTKRFTEEKYFYNLYRFMQNNPSKN